MAAHSCGGAGREARGDPAPGSGRLICGCTVSPKDRLAGKGGTALRQVQTKDILVRQQRKTHTCYLGGNGGAVARERRVSRQQREGESWGGGTCRAKKRLMCCPHLKSHCHALDPGLQSRGWPRQRPTRVRSVVGPARGGRLPRGTGPAPEAGLSTTRCPLGRAPPGDSARSLLFLP